jgi:outer membrane protein TolC
MLNVELRRAARAITNSSCVHLAKNIMKISMKPVFILLVPFAAAVAQGPPAQNPAGPLKAAPAAGQQAAEPTLQVVAPPIAPTGPSVNLTLQDALQRARQYSQQVYSAQFAAQLAHEDAVQAKAALLPTASDFTQYIYTQPNGTPSGVFVANDGPHVYNQQAQVHADIYNPGKLADYHRLLAVEAVARAKYDLATRGLFATVTQNYYSTVVNQRKIANAQASLTEAQQFLDITRKQEAGGEAAHADVVKAQLQVQQRERELQDAAAAYEKARIGLSVLIFPSYGQAYTLADDLDTVTELPPFPDLQTRATTNSPDLRVAEATVNQQNYALRSAKSGYLPSLGIDYFYGLDANTFAIHNREGQNQLGSVVQATMTVPIWNWGATRSKVKQAEIGVQQAKADLSLAQRTLMSELDADYLEAQVASAQLASLKSSADLSVENLRLTRLRYTAGEATAQEVVDAQAQLVAARNAYDDGRVRYRVAIANLQTLTGAF